MKKSKLVLAIGLILITTSAFALPLPKVSRDQVSLPESFTKDYDFEGIVELSDCSGSLFKFETSKDTDPGLILTNGHCLEFGMPKPGKVIFNRPSSRTFQLLDRNGESAGNVNAVEVVYATMTRTDMSIYKLNETYADIEAKHGVRPFVLGKQRPARNTSIDIVSGYWHRGYRCAVEEFAYRLKEDAWTFEDSIRYSRPGCETIGGTSGSPIIETGTRTIVGVNNTGNESGEKCTMNNPCEIDIKGNVIFEKGYSYGQETYWVYSCLDANNNIDLSVKGCELPH